MPPTLTTPGPSQEPSRSSLFARQAPPATVTVTASSANHDDASTLSGGAIAGIVIGSIAGFLLLLWIWRSCRNLGAPPQEREFLYNDVEPKRRRRHGSRRRSRRYSHGSELSLPPPVIIRESSRSSRGPPDYVYASQQRGRGY